MLRLLGFIIKFGVLVAGAMWLANRPGTVTIQWMDYDISLNFGFFLLLLFLCIITSVGLARLMLYVRNLPGRYRDKKSLVDAEKGLKALTLSLSAAAAGDTGYARYHAERAEALLPGSSQPLPVLLQAYALRREGHQAEAEHLLQHVLKDREGSLLAARALINNALHNGDLPRALHYGRQTLSAYQGKDAAWLIKTLYGLETQAMNWDEALSLLNRAAKNKSVPEDQAGRDRAAILIAQSLETIIIKDKISLLQKALKAHHDFVPAVTMLARLYMEQGKKRAAYKLVENAWAAHPHPELAALWLYFFSQQNSRKLSAVDWAHRLVKTNPHHIESFLLRARVAIDEQQWEEARAALQSAEELKATRRVYKLWAELEERAGRGEMAIRIRFEALATAEQDAAWICRVSGKTYEHWQPIADAPGGFNTIEWGHHAMVAGDLLAARQGDEGMFELLRL